VEKCARAGRTADGYIIRHIRFACWIAEAIYTHWEYVIIIAFQQQQWLFASASVLHYNTVPVLWKRKVVLWTLHIKYSSYVTENNNRSVLAVGCLLTESYETHIGGWGIFAMLKQYIYCSYDWALSGYCSLYFSKGCAAIPWTSLLVLLTGFTHWCL
jgi:hypothetical protein